MILGMTISRGLISLDSLELEDPAGGLTIMSFGPGPRTMRLEHATSPVSDGAILTGAVADLDHAFLVLRVFGADADTVLTKVEEVEAAFNQWWYMLTVTMDDREETWYCQPANTSRGASGVYNAAELMGGWQDLTLTIPKQPFSVTYTG